MYYTCYTFTLCICIDDPLPILFCTMMKYRYFTVHLFVILLSLITTHGARLFGSSPLHRRSLSTTSLWVHSPPSYETRYYEQQVDHFNVGDNRTFSQRYLYSGGAWDGEGPLFVYTGNEGDITWFFNNTGFAWDLAANFHSLLVFIEHRFYGESLPFGPASYQDAEHLQFLSSEQALADFATVITDLKKELNTTVPAIAIGGSYGGMLAAWLRMKYPDVVLGALAASAPVWYFTGLTPCNSSYVTITRDFEEATPGYPSNPFSCTESIRLTWLSIFSVAKRDGLDSLTKTFHLCHSLESASELADWLEETWFNMAMVDYPYAADFLEPLPAWPINKTCEILSRKFDFDVLLLEAVADALSVYYNSSGQTQCYNTTQEATLSLGSRGWDYQACSEMVMPMCSDGFHDMFMNNSWNFTAYAEGCMKKYGVKPDPYRIETLYGGKNISAHTNIIFSNGLLDPWSGGGVLESISDNMVAVVIPKGAHHLDLRSPTAQDPPALTQARQTEIDYISKWLENSKTLFPS